MDKDLFVGTQDLGHPNFCTGLPNHTVTIKGETDS
jgi:hypothetical protein